MQNIPNFQSKQNLLEGFLHKILMKIPHVQYLRKELQRYETLQRYPPGQYYSPIVDWPKIKKDTSLWETSLPKEVDLNEKGQLDLLLQFDRFYSDMPWQARKKSNLRYYFENDFYSYTDAIILYSMIRLMKPKRIIEVGSGFSSALILDTNQLFMNNEIEVQFIEPYPERLFSLFSKEDYEKQMVKEEGVQKIPLSDFQQLEPGDFLFIDSSHVSKTGSDVNYILFEILPVLKKGVYIHFHDIFYPFEYPKLWAYQGRNWNEIYLLRAFLMNNNIYRIRMFSDFLHKNFPTCFNRMQKAIKNTGGSFWLEKLN